MESPICIRQAQLADVEELAYIEGLNFSKEAFQPETLKELMVDILVSPALTPAPFMSRSPRLISSSLYKSEFILEFRRHTSVSLSIPGVILSL